MLKDIKRNNKGFTIIEVLIVLAIAGLILLVVFLAVPALQRNSRNTQRKGDVSQLLGAVSEYVSNNAGSLPGSNAVFSAAFSNNAPKLGYYTNAANVSWVNPGGPAAPADPGDLDKVVVSSYSKCNGSAATTSGATQRSIVAVYDVEGSSGAKLPQCVES
ncbi:MAG: hypothetical protein NVS1B7_2670 [Candidatus Saccharimonadales bacterium]